VTLRDVAFKFPLLILASLSARARGERSNTMDAGIEVLHFTLYWYRLLIVSSVSHAFEQLERDSGLCVIHVSI
jgi:hypothetical protein